MPATRSNRVSRQREAEEALKRSALADDQEQTGEIETADQPALPDLTGGPVAPEAWLALQQSIGNSAVGGLMERRRAGQSLPPGVRHDMEASFGQNFGQVQIHSGPEVDQAAQSLQAGAFTVGDEIFVHSDLPGLETPFGRQVLGEELAHVAQGAGREGANRVTSPAETAENQARQAGAAAAAGQPAAVAAAPEAAGAVARFSLKDVEEEAKKFLGIAGKAPGTETDGKSADAGVVAAAEKSAVKTGLSDEEKDRLRAGAVEPLMFLYTELAAKFAAAPDGAPTEDQLLPISDTAASIPNFIYSFAGSPEIQATLEQTAVSAASGRNSILMAIRPAKTLADTAQAIWGTGNELGGLAVAQTPAAPAAPNAATPGAAEPPAAEGLTPAEAEQLKTGAVDPLLQIAEQLKAAKPDFGLIIGRMQGIPSLLRSFSKPAPLVPQLHRMAMTVEIQIRTLEAAQGGAKAAILEAMGTWQSAILTLMGLTANAASGGAAPAAVTGAAAGGDEDQKKPT